MSLVACTDCGREISVNATACPQCGAPRHKSESAGPSRKAALFWAALGIFAVFVLMSAVGGGGTSRSDAWIHQQMCRETKDAAHYIFTSSRTQSDVVRVTDRVIAERKYPTIGDQGVGMIGGMAGMALGNMSTEQFVRQFEESEVCQQ